MPKNPADQPSEVQKKQEPQKRSSSVSPRNAKRLKEDTPKTPEKLSVVCDMQDIFDLSGSELTPITDISAWPSSRAASPASPTQKRPERIIEKDKSKKTKTSMNHNLVNPFHKKGAVFQEIEAELGRDLDTIRSITP